MPGGEWSIRPLRTSDLPAAVELLTRAFHEDPGALIIEPDAARRPAALRIMFAPVVRWAQAYGEVATAVAADGRIGGIATFVPPGHESPTPDEIEAFDFRAGERLVPEAWSRNEPMVDFIESQHERAIQGPHWRLDFFGVEPELQGAGLGGRLIATGHAKADAAGERVWLETFTPQNVRWYEGRGYRVVCEAPVPGSPFTLWGLVREPQGGR
jgi:ribosomal protein S18 acetylase RimI-like enzyme